MARGFAASAALVLVAFALPVESWRTGQDPRYAFETMPLDQRIAFPRRVWVDTDAACGEGAWRDPDDCLALLALAGRDDVRIVGISTVFGNASLEVTDRVTRELVEQVAAAGGPGIPVFRGCDRATSPCPEAQGAHAALRAALHDGPLTILALGPLTNVAAVLGSHRPARGHGVHVIAVMGRRPGHRFHPTEGRSNSAMLFGHGPVFRDLNLVLDPAAAAAVLAARAPLTLVPYEAARNLLVAEHDLDRIAGRDAAGAWVAARSRAWLERWQRAIGLDGFYPFDLAAAMVFVAPERFGCARVQTWVGRDPRLTVFERSPALLVSQQGLPPGERADAASAVYCTGVQAKVGDVL